MGHTQNALANIISKEFKLPVRTGREILQKVLDIVADDIVYTGRMELNGIGTFSISKRPSETINHLHTGQPITIPGKKILTFRSSKTIRRRLNPPKETGKAKKQKAD